MLEILKESLQDILLDKRVSLVMLYHKDGEILWSRGRAVFGTSIAEGRGFPAGLIQKNMAVKKSVSDTDRLIYFHEENVSESAQKLLIKHILIYPVNDYFLYIDSGCTLSFSKSEIEKIKLLADLLQKTISQIKHQNRIFGEPSGSGEAMNQVKELILKFSIEEDCVLLCGETGVGKSYVAELIHRYSGLKGNFIVCDTTTVNQELLESELFGHKRGAFTGAVADKKGLIDTADCGTLFFDEISEVSLSFQAKLLRFIETKNYRVVGDPQEKKADVRIIAATNSNLAQMVSAKLFREDLFFRLNILSIKIPPLRERKNDIQRLVIEKSHYLKGKIPGKHFWEALADYRWPGNIRELFTVIKRAGILCGSPITGDDIKKLL
ncbi:MAG: sigma-54-dependent Fis family transcriptional regulator, partial [Desulfobacteraceae bacterium]